MTDRTMRIAVTLGFMLMSGLGARAQEHPAAMKKAPARSASVAKAKVPSRARVKGKVIPLAKRLDLNSATKAQLERLPGVTPAYADQIIAHRPYLTNEHLVLNKVVPESVYFSIRDRVVARPPKAKPAPAKK